ncbi:hypothetical protein [Joostella sp. CR20]|uniref:hypothetical protein n=1 Tax=Joostella sp. CR20 TaxID=2804312 RepID=UPI00313CBEF3
MLIYILREINIPRTEINVWETVSYYFQKDKKQLSNEFQDFHDRLTYKYPCLSESSDTVWGDGPLINNFGDKVACIDLIIGFSKEEEKKSIQALNYIVSLATEFNFDLYLEGTNKIIRPNKVARKYDQLTSKGIILALILMSLFNISDHVYNIENEIPFKPTGGKRAIVDVAFYGIAKVCIKVVDYDTLQFILKNITIIVIIWYLYDIYNYFIFKRRSQYLIRSSKKFRRN